MDIIKNVVVSVDVNNNAIVMSAFKLINYFMKNEEDIEKILKVDITEDNNKVKKLVVYAKAKPKNQFIESLIVKTVLKNDILSVFNTKYEFVKNGDDVYIKLYLQPTQSQNVSTTNSTEEVDF
jgi:NCAIR mutase (PurE)-related protein